MLYTYTAGAYAGARAALRPPRGSMPGSASRRTLAGSAARDPRGGTHKSGEKHTGTALLPRPRRRLFPPRTAQQVCAEVEPPREDGDALGAGDGGGNLGGGGGHGEHARERGAGLLLGGDHARGDVPGADSGDGHARGPQQRVQALAVAAHGHLGRVIRGGERRRHEAGQRGNQHHVAALAREKGRQQRVDRVDNTQDVGYTTE